MARAVIGQAEVGAAEDGTEGDVDDLEIVLRRLGVGDFGKGIEVIKQEKITLTAAIDARGDFGEGLGEAAADD